MPNQILSKSQYLTGLQCPKALWLLKNSPHLKKDSSSITQQLLFNEGREVEEVARELFPGGIEVKYGEENLKNQIMETQELINGGVKTIYEGTFEYDDIIIKADLLQKGEGGWNLYEIKSSSEISDIQKDDIALQYYVLKESNLISISSVSLIHINKQYIREGKIEVSELFTTVEMTEFVIQEQEEIQNKLILMRNILNREIPQVEISYDRCDMPYECEFKNHCWAHIPPVSVFNLSRLTKANKFKLYTQGIVNLKDLPKDYKLSAFQKAQVEAELSGNDVVDNNSLSRFLSEEINYPLYFLDFETFYTAIPRFNGIRPRQKIPFQYSLHLMNHENSDLKHEEFLGEEGIDPRQNLVKKLIKDVGEEGSILTYSGFEKGVIKALAHDFPEYSVQLMKIHDRLVDLMAPFQKGYIYKQSMQGSYSIKKVLQAFYSDHSDLDYKKLNISDGLQASVEYANLYKKNNADKAKTKDDLLKYCRLDTKAMVVVFKKIQEMAG